MKPKLPGYYSSEELVELLGLTRNNFHRSGLAAAIEHHEIDAPGGPLRFYPADAVHDWHAWITLIRPGLVALGHLHPKHKLVAEEGGRLPWYVGTGDYEAECPTCGGPAVGTLQDQMAGRLWCPKDGIVEYDIEEEGEDEV